MGAIGREMRDMMRTCKPTILEIVETKTRLMWAIQKSWAGDTLQEVLAVRKLLVAPSRGRLVIEIQRGLPYALTEVYNEREDSTNGLIQEVIVDLRGRLRVAGA